jgi:succinate dehydrogenase hydrophobic anchor subunit
MVAGARNSRLAAFVLMRATAVLLAVLVLGHFAVTHVVNDVASTGSNFAIRRWSSVLWLAWDSTMLAAALAHAGCGVWLVVDELAPAPRRRRVLHAALAVVVTVVFALGATAIGVTAINQSG